MHINDFKTRVMATFRLDLHSYKEKQLQRRLDSYLNRLKLKIMKNYLINLPKKRIATKSFWTF